MMEQSEIQSAAKSLRDDVASYRANGTIITDETLRDWEHRLTKLAHPEQSGMAHLLCGHWTFFRLGGNREATARCDLPEGHEGLHKFWWSPETGESFSWSDSYERHQVRDD